MNAARSSDEEETETSDEEPGTAVNKAGEPNLNHMIPSELLSEQDLLHFLSLKPERNQVWRKLPGRGVFSSITRAADTSSLGVLDDFPVEILNMILENLDLQSLSLVLQTCLKGKVLVEKLPAYRDLVTYASDIFTALSQMGLIGLHPVNTIYAALKSDRCVACGQYGENLFLPTCQRCCQACHCSNHDFWTIRVDGDTGASEVFNLGPEHLQRVPNFSTFGKPDDYGQRRSSRHKTGSTQQRSVYITSKAAMDLGLEANGSKAKLAEHLRNHLEVLKKRGGRGGFRSHVLLGRTEEFATRILTWNQALHHDTVYFYSGPCASAFGIIHFPSLINNISDLGRLCYGCNRAPEFRFRSRKAKVQYLESRHRVRSKSEFLEHVQQCSWAKQWVVEFLKRRERNGGARITDENWFQRQRHFEVFAGWENTWFFRNPGTAMPKRKQGGHWEVEKMWSLDVSSFLPPSR